MPIQKEDLTVDCSRESYVVRTGEQSVFGHTSIEDLTAIILTYCNFGDPIERGQPLYVLSFSQQAKNSLDEKEIRALKTIVDYHNRIVLSINHGGD